MSNTASETRATIEVNQLLLFFLEGFLNMGALRKKEKLLHRIKNVSWSKRYTTRIVQKRNGVFFQTIWGEGAPSLLRNHFGRKVIPLILAGVVTPISTKRVCSLVDVPGITYKIHF